ncbi:serine hydrolase domain-containing protein [Pedobacter cryoconitis]|uniref:CubicO group peptidase (Beta-lactamase class C family) n=1 Tax=Pedobacter cryoconitis TaxID=188932 RepID=A0A7X0J0I2_9SPHI|nr:serine hydrolase [Pedobacter cryoconitis]MBB6498850.1 CubicO group peptidase (beta-lactamase class C family) [Pedobacter cryoconitis]
MTQRLLLSLILVFVCTEPIFSQSQSIKKGDDFYTFQTGEPEEVGFSSVGLSAIFPYVKKQQVNVHSLMIIRDDKIVFDAYFYPYTKGLQHDIASCTKSVTSLLIGIAIDKGFIRNENELVKNYFPEIKSYSKNFQTLTIKDLLTMTSGLDCGGDNEETVFSGLFKTSDWPAYIFNIPSINTPGKHFSYCSCNFYLLAEILYRSTKLSPEKFADKYLFKPMGINNFYWTKNYKGVNYGWGDLALKPYDMAKIGRLLLNNGKWNSAQLISEDYIRKATSIQIPLDNKGYGYGFWVDNDHSFNAVGRGGQRIHVDRLYKAIVVATGGGYDWDEKGGLDEHISHSLQFDAFSKNQAAADSLNVATANAAKISGILPVESLASAHKDILFNRTLIFEKNSLNISTARIITSGNMDTIFTITNSSGKVVNYPLGIGTKYRYFKDTSSNHVYAIRGYWKSQDDFVIDFNTLTKINNYKIDFKLKENQVTIKEGTQGINDTLQVHFDGNQ